jgi:hypothetical protein
MRIFYKTFVKIKFNKYTNKTKQLICVRSETLSSSGNTIQDSENAALEYATTLMTNDPTIKISYELKTIKIKSKRMI